MAVEATDSVRLCTSLKLHGRGLFKDKIRHSPGKTEEDHGTPVRIDGPGDV